MKHSFIILFFLCFKVVFSQQAPDYIFKHLDQANGLLHNNVFSITQDKKGFIWIGTANGLQRYDGLRFVNYQNELSAWNNKSIAIDDIYTDDSRTWVLSEYQVGKLETVTNKFTGYDAEKMLHDPLFKYEAYTDSKNNRWLLGDFSIYKYDSVSKKMELYLFSLPNENINNRSTAIVKDTKHNMVWAVLWKGLLLFDRSTKKVYSHQYNPLQHPLLKKLAPQGYAKIMMDSHKNIWLCSWDSLLYQYNATTKKVSTYSLSDIKKTEGYKKNTVGTLVVYNIYEDDRLNIWVGTANAGLLKYNPKDDNFEYITATEKNNHKLQYNYNVFCIFQDKEENIWLGTDRGINIFNPYRLYIQSIHHEQNNAASLPKNEITDFIEADNGDIVVGTWGGGITIYDNQFRFKKNIILKGVSENNLVWSFIKNDDGKIWVGCQHGYLHIYNAGNKTLTTIHPPEFENSTIRCMQKDIQGNIWFGLQNGKIAKWDKQLNKFFSYNDNIHQPVQALFPVVNIFIDHDNNFWAGTINGLKQFDPQKRVYTKIFLPDENNIHSISAVKITAIQQYDDSTLLIGSINGGLNFFNIKTNKFSLLNFNSGLPSKFIHAIKKDGKNNIWLTTDYGLYKYNIQDKRTITYNIDPGLISSSFESNNFYQLHDGRWLTATSTQIISFHPDSLICQGQHKIKVAITGFTISDKHIFIDSMLFVNKPFELTYKQNFVTIEFSAMDFQNIKQTQYYYKLSGVDKDWVNADIKGFASYTNLAPGSYTFSVKAAEEDITSQITSFSFIITPPFWNTWWFKSLIVLSVVFVVYTLVRRRIKNIRHEAELKHKIAETEMMALRAQMNPHFIFNCINAIDNLIQTNQKDKATNYLARFAKLIRAVLDSSKNNVVPFHKEYETLNLFLQLEQFRCSNKFEYELKADEEILQGDYKVPPLLAQPFIENAIHHGLMNKTGTDKKLSIRIGIEKKKIKYSIADNGVGRQKALQIKNLNKPDHVSYGIQISTERIHLYNKNEEKKDVVITDLYNSSGEAAGTQVELLVKIYNN